MRYLILLPLLLFSCAKQAIDSTTDSAVTMAKPSPTIFTDTLKYQEDRLKAEANYLLKSGSGISAEDAERCVRSEAARPAVLDLCYLLFAYGREESTELYRKIREAAPNADAKNPTMAIALAWRPELARSLSAPLVLKAIEALSNAPAELSTGLAATWMQGQPLLTAQTFKQKISVGETPQDRRAYFSFWKTYDIAFFKQEIARFCSKDAEGDSQWRCWRLQAAMNQTTLAGTSDLAPAIDEKDRSWQTFERVFPVAAEKLKSMTYGARL